MSSDNQMKAAVLKQWGTPLSIENIPIPSLGTGEVIVDVVYAPVISYSNEVFSGARKYMLALPVVPGCGAIGRVRALGPDSTHLKVGEWVLCDATIRSRDELVNPDITIQGWSARGEGGMKLQKYFHHGSFAECVRIPTEAAIRIGKELTKEESLSWNAFATYLIPFGGILSSELQPGEIMLINGATGPFGSAGIAVALAVGAGCVIAAGRNEKALIELKERFGERLRIAVLSGNEKEDTEIMKKVAPGPIDCVLDLLPPSAPSTVARAAIMAVRPYGRVVLMGGVGMLGGAGLDLPYPWIMRSCITIKGQWLYSTDAPAKLVKLINSGLLKLDHFKISSFNLDDANAAVEHAAANVGPFKITVLHP